ncbi:right-handed parallel beta-helix repeat-containing protein [Microbulbifer agarilyticus]|uniref:PKD domain-containing protein n=1 Tax=Microbulbifer agarilyticus TaxID=260552 RepID=UPI001C93E186|nr:PKD domain-containing protein [Microbulbifer agarilyticus]MBY6190731.1 right-handed parallel beta-helix repeat-containing protein [Microbulbifer agarilyticus]
MKHFFAINLTCALLIGCGGGGSDSNGGDSPINRPPVAEAGANRSTNLGQAVSLDGAQSSDPDGDTLSFTWEIVATEDGSNPNLSSPNGEVTNFTSDVAGSYDIRLTVNDGSASDSDIVTVAVLDADTLIADAGTGYFGPEGGEIRLDGGASAAPTGGILSYSWSIVAAPATSSATLADSNTVSPTLESPSIGSYQVQLVVSTEDGESATDIANVLIVDFLPIMQSVEHYTQILPSDDTRIVYVSKSGDDANDGLSSETPVQSIQHGVSLLRDGFPDWLALKSGDTWETGIGGWGKSGRSPEEPMVITSYGTGDSRPLLRTHDRTGLRYQGGGGSPEYVDYLVIHGLHFYAASRDINDNDAFTGVSNDRGISWLRGTNGLLVEDNVFQLYKEGIVLQETDGFDIRNVLIKNNIFLDSYHTDGHSQGIYLANTDHVRIERNVFDHIGWNEDVSGAVKTIFNHSIYVQTSNRDIEVVDNIITRSSSHGLQLRSGGLIEGNVAVQNPIGLMLGGDSATGDPGVIKDNVVLHGNDIAADAVRGWGIDAASGIVSAEVTGNIIAHEDSIAENPRAFNTTWLTDVTENAVFNWGEQSQPASNFRNPNLTIEDFDTMAGGRGSIDSFIEQVRTHSMRKPNSNYDVEEIRDYFKNAFSAPAQ